jgi:hypothetical protein
MATATGSDDNYTHTRIKTVSLEKAKAVVAKGAKYRSVAHMLEVLIDKEAKK